ncbi:MAG: hypothetical protein LBD46_08875 [Endomicrobium sp.]|jgi:beta-glucuronidase|nr:hypothetical protein [Endomicrobium sp.]
MKRITFALLSVFFFVSFCLAQTSSRTLLAILDAADKYNQSMTYEKIKPFPIYDTGSEEWIDYEKYGEFKNLGTKDYEYVVKDLEGLAAASGEGIYPNIKSVLISPDYNPNPKKLKGKTEEYLYNDNMQRNFYRWATADGEDPGMKLYNAAVILENSGNYKYAVKAYYACLVFFPKTVGYTQWKTPWYVAPVCAAKIKYLTREYPEIGVKIEDDSIIIENIFDNDVSNDIFIIHPGKLAAATAEDFKRVKIDLSKNDIKNITGKGKVKLITYNNNHLQLTVDDRPYVIRAISYSPSRVGLSPDFGTLDNLRDWSFDDYNNNKKIDGPYDTVVDINRNNKRDGDEKTVGDFALMREMGINTIRIYHYADLNKNILKDGYESYGFMYLMGNLIGMYGKDSGAGWFDGTDYTDKEQRKNMLESVRHMVEEYKDEPYVLMWVLGNENNYGSIGVQGESVGSACLAPTQPDAYYAFVNECAKLIKSLDPQKRPVAICNGDVFMLDYCAKNAPDIDIYGANVYRGNFGFGQIWQDIARVYRKPVLITEYGCPAYAKGWEKARIEEGQSDYHRACWNSIEDNIAGIKDGAGNALGGVIFEWVDEWWKGGASTDPWYHDVDSQWAGPFLDGRAYEEWFGICDLGNGANSTFKRQLRKSYFMYRKLWKEYEKISVKESPK